MISPARFDAPCDVRIGGKWRRRVESKTRRSVCDASRTLNGHSPRQLPDAVPVGAVRSKTLKDAWGSAISASHTRRFSLLTMSPQTRRLCDSRRRPANDEASISSASAHAIGETPLDTRPAGNSWKHPFRCVSHRLLPAPCGMSPRHEPRPNPLRALDHDHRSTCQASLIRHSNKKGGTFRCPTHLHICISNLS